MGSPCLHSFSQDHGLCPLDMAKKPPSKQHCMKETGQCVDTVPWQRLSAKSTWQLTSPADLCIPEAYASPMGLQELCYAIHMVQISFPFMTARPTAYPPALLWGVHWCEMPDTCSSTCRKYAAVTSASVSVGLPQRSQHNASSAASK